MALKKALATEPSDIQRDASIQRFEFCIELAWKTAKKVMGTYQTSPKQVIREMAQAQLIEDIELWLQAIDKRNLSSHTYKEALAIEVYQFAKVFLPHLEKLMITLSSQ
ncbi:MAG: HI0074 family nucleotidyltransferase substrate-binding subunit [Deltaproteobacteria bacterium]|nr:HI0074 family nucleotidyltransferase substrate-binding subunit [Deltaproteobacteria bacterium]